jgi:hypothetical protein
MLTLEPLRLQPPQISLGTSNALSRKNTSPTEFQQRGSIDAGYHNSTAMAPTFDTLSDHDFDDVDEEEIDFSGKIE